MQCPLSLLKATLRFLCIVFSKTKLNINFGSLCLSRGICLRGFKDFVYRATLLESKNTNSRCIFTTNAFLDPWNLSSKKTIYTHALHTSAVSISCNIYRDMSWEVLCCLHYNMCWYFTCATCSGFWFLMSRLGDTGTISFIPFYPVWNSNHEST